MYVYSGGAFHKVYSRKDKTQFYTKDGKRHNVRATAKLHARKSKGGSVKKRSKKRKSVKKRSKKRKSVSRKRKSVSRKRKSKKRKSVSRKRKSVSRKRTRSASRKRTRSVRPRVSLNVARIGAILDVQRSAARRAQELHKK